MPFISIPEKIQHGHLFQLVFTEKLGKQKRKTQGAPALPESINTDFSQTMEINNIDVAFSQFSSRINAYFFLCQNTRHFFPIQKYDMRALYPEYLDRVSLISRTKKGSK